MKLSEKLLGKNALKWQFSAGRIWCDSSLGGGCESACDNYIHVLLACFSSDGTCEGRTSHQLEHFKHVQTLYYYILFSNIRIARRLVQSDIHNQICNVLRWIQTTSLHPEVIFFGCQKSLIEATFGFMKKRGHLQRDIDFRCKMLVWKLSWTSWKEPMRNHVMKVDEAFDSGHNYR